MITYISHPTFMQFRKRDSLSMWIMLDQVAVLLLMEVQDFLASFYKAAWAMGAKELEDENHFCIDLIQMMKWSILRDPFQEPHPLQVKSATMRTLSSRPL